MNLNRVTFRKDGPAVVIDVFNPDVRSEPLLRLSDLLKEVSVAHPDGGEQPGTGLTGTGLTGTGLTGTGLTGTGLTGTVLNDPTLLPTSLRRRTLDALAVLAETLRGALEELEGVSEQDFDRRVTQLLEEGAGAMQVMRDAGLQAVHVDPRGASFELLSVHAAEKHVQDRLYEVITRRSDGCFAVHGVNELRAGVGPQGRQAYTWAAAGERA